MIVEEETLGRIIRHHNQKPETPGLSIAMGNA
jgi:hypothetical protein